jgi:hypothetical protein
VDSKAPQHHRSTRKSKAMPNTFAKVFFPPSTQCVLLVAGHRKPSGAVNGTFSPPPDT